MAACGDGRGAGHTVGVCGLGAMGAPMAVRLVQSKRFERVVLYNRTVEKATDLRAKLLGDPAPAAGPSVSIEVATTISEFASATLGTTVIMMLHGDEATEAFVGSYLEAASASSAAAGALPTLLINSATISESCVSSINDKLMAQRTPSYRFVNATVTGRPEHVARGELCVWLSCSGMSSEEPQQASFADAGDRVCNPAAFVQNQVAPAYAKAVKVISLSDVTASARYKICTNFLVYGIGELLGEALMLLDANGLERETLLHWTGNVIPAGNLMDIYAGKMVRREFGDRGETVGAAIDVGVKDLKLMKASLEQPAGEEAAAASSGAAETQLRLPVLDAALGHMEQQLADRQAAGRTNVEWCSFLEQMEKRKKRRLK